MSEKIPTQEEKNNKKNNFLDWPEGVIPPEGLNIKFVGIDNKYMKKAFQHAIEQTKSQTESGIRAVASALVLKSGKVVLGVSGELEDEDNVTWHKKEGKCARYDGGTGTANSDYDSCPGCRHQNHSERSAIRKAQRDGHDTEGSKIYLYGHWWACTPCMEASQKAGVDTIYLLENSRDLFDRGIEGQEERMKEFENKHIEK